MTLRFHWMLPKSGEVEMPTAGAAARYRVESVLDDSPARIPEPSGWLAFARLAERAGIDSVLISFSRFEPDPLLVACALGRETTRLGFILAVRSGVIAPAMLVQQINTLSGLIGGRVSVNLVAGSSLAEQHGYGDFLDHDQRYARAEEFLAVCNRLWRGEGRGEFEGEHYRLVGTRLSTPFQAPNRRIPEVYVSGHSAAASQLAARQASCWLRVIDTPHTLEPSVAAALAHGLEVCLRLCIVCRPTRAEALAVLDELLAEPVVCSPSAAIPSAAVVKADSQMYRESASASSWLAPNLWTGLVAVRGPVWTTLVGTPDDLAAALIEYGRLGITQFILSGWPEHDEVEIFGREVLPRIRDAEART